MALENESRALGSLLGQAVAGRTGVGQAREPFPDSGLDALVLAAAADAPDAVLFRDDARLVTAGVAASRIRQTAGLLRSAGLVPGERLLIVAGAEANAVLALAAALRLGLEAALVPAGLNAVELAAHARSAGAVALLGPSRYGEVSLGDTYLSAASVVDTLRVVATQGPELVDGAADLSPEALDALPPATDNVVDRMTETPVIGTFQGPAHKPTLILHRQAALFADALSLVEHARINPSKRLISTLPPATMAGLVAGPFAALVGASSLFLHGPFDTRRFLGVLDEDPGAHLVVPCAFGSAFADKHLSSGLSSLVLVSRFADANDFALPPQLICRRPIVDLYAFGEDTLLARRRTDGEALPPARVTDKSLGGGLGARLNRARADADFDIHS